MGGKRAKSESQSYSGSGQQWATPYAVQGVHSVQSVFDQNQPGLQALTDTTRNQVVNPLLGKFQSSLGPAGQASNYYSDVLSGKYMNGNPYMGQILDRLKGDITNNVDSHFALAGRYGSDAHGAGLTRELANAEGNLLYQNYGDEMNRMGQAAQGAQAGNVADSSSLLAAIAAGAQLPYTGSSNLASSLGALFSGGNEKSKSKGPKPGLLDYLAQMASNAASAYAGGQGGG